MKLGLVCACALVASSAGAADFPPGDAAKEGIDPAALKELVDAAEKSKSSSLVVVKNGKLIGEWYFGGAARPIETMSATKSIVSLAVGRLLDDGKLKSLDQPIHELFPEWKQGRKKLITLRHLLNHTSGLQAQPTTGEEIYPAPDFVKLALAAELDGDPGARFFYNNKAVNLLAGVVAAAAGKPLDEYAREVLFAPLGITDWKWTRDRAGNPHAMAGLRLRAIDLAKIGVLLADGGTWQGKRVISKSWIDESTKPGQAYVARCGLLWWLVFESMKFVIDDSVIAGWRKAGQSEEFIAKVMPMKDRLLARDEFFDALAKIFGGKAGLERWYDQTWRRGLADGKVVPGPIAGFYADGYLGQYLVVLPKAKLVAVRQLEAHEDNPDAKNYDGLMRFPQLVQALIKK
ncbi:MAG TPA: serine hydrolase [Polyangia bacterium]|nr:serine hydrolase [Polyangia bacterium]